MRSPYQGRMALDYFWALVSRAAQLVLAPELL